MYKFIFIDDEDYIRELFPEILDFQEYGFHLEASFATAEEAYRYLEGKTNIAAVITDIRMGVQSGIDMCEQIRERDPDILLVVMSGYGEFEYARRAIHCNVFEYLLKPTGYADLDRLFRDMKKTLDERRPKEPDVTETEYIGLIDKIKEIIQRDYAGTITLDMVAEEIGMNPAYLSRFFKKHTDMNFLEYLTKVRIEAAIKLLADPTYKIYEICLKVGYTSLPHFLKLFKQHTNLTPSEYRDNKNKK